MSIGSYHTLIYTVLNVHNSTYIDKIDIVRLNLILACLKAKDKF
jgi:hypothetical protein